jgi:hypothetical protein
MNEKTTDAWLSAAIYGRQVATVAERYLTGELTRDQLGEQLRPMVDALAQLYASLPL